MTSMSEYNHAVEKKYDAAQAKIETGEGGILNERAIRDWLDRKYSPEPAAPSPTSSDWLRIGWACGCSQRVKIGADGYTERVFAEHRQGCSLAEPHKDHGEQ